MKKTFLIVAAMLVFAACSNDKEGVSTNDINIGGGGDKPAIQFDEEVHDFGKITQGEKVSYSFHFKNTGKGNLLVSSAHASCGCTVPTPPKDPIPTGGESKIDVTFDSNGKSGTFNKEITVITNCDPNTKVLKIKGEIIVPVSNEPNVSVSKEVKR